MLSDVVQCKQLRRELFLGNTTDQDDVEQGSPGRESSDDETDGLSRRGVVVLLPGTGRLLSRRDAGMMRGRLGLA